MTSLAPRKPVPDQSSQIRGHLRRDIQGLRAVAVVLVILNHLVGHPSGGFVGVDVFFVISGFLITGLLLREHGRTGKISLRGFYARRVKRLGPAAIVTVVVVLLVATQLFTTVRLQTTSIDAVWAVLFGENWRQIAVGTDYLHATTAISPLQHFWSLSVEEQFYFVWPLLLIATLAVGRRRATRHIAVVAIACIGAASLVWGFWESSTQPTWAYFSTFSRAWELAAGAVLAIAAPVLTRLGTRTRFLFAWGGLLAIAGSALELNSNSVFPVPGAILPVAGALAVIGSGVGGEAPLLWPLRNRVSVFIGTISYSLYLWHFPVIIFTSQLLPGRGARYVLSSVALTSGLALLSYYWIEQPLRQLSWRPSTRVPRRIRPIRGLALGGLAVAIVGTSVLTVQFRTPPRIDASPVAAAAGSVDSAAAASGREHAVVAALAASKWPALEQTQSHLGADAKAPQWVDDGCLSEDTHALPDPVANSERCVFGNPHATHSVLVYGDSMAISLVPGVLRALRGTDWQVDVWTMAECAAVDVSTFRGDGSFNPTCQPYRDSVVKQAAHSHPDVIIASSAASAYDRFTDRASGTDALAEWQAGTERMLHALSPLTGRLILLDSPPATTDLSICASPISRPIDCVTGVQPDYAAVVEAQRAAVRAVSLQNVVYPADTTWFCSPAGICPAFIGTTVTSADGSHLTRQASTQLAPLLRPLILSARNPGSALMSSSATF